MRRLLVLPALAASVLAVAVTANAADAGASSPTGISSVTSAPHDRERLMAYWTLNRMRSAKAMPTRMLTPPDSGESQAE